MATFLRSNSSSSVSSVSSLDSNNSEVVGKDLSKPKNLVQRTRDALGDIGNRLKKNPPPLGGKGTLHGARKELVGAKNEFAVPTNRPPRAAVKPKAKTVEKSSGKALTNHTRREVLQEDEVVSQSLRSEATSMKLGDVVSNFLVDKSSDCITGLKNLEKNKENASIFTTTSNTDSKSEESTPLAEEVEEEAENEYNPKLSSELTVDAVGADQLEIVDIDQDEWNPLLVQTYVKEIYDYVFWLEKKYPIRIRYLEGRLINSRMRAVLLDWLIEVHTQFGLMPETLYMAAKMLDRYLQTDRTISRKQLQLVGVTAMYIAAKYEEVCTPAVHDFAAVSDNAFTIGDVKKMEQSMLLTLNFDLAFPPAVFFLRRFSKAASATMAIHSMAKYIMELSLIDYATCHLFPSEQAAGSLALALLILENKTLTKVWTPTIQHYTRYTLEAIKSTVTLLAGVVSRAQDETQKLKAVNKKYTGKRLNYTSLAPELKAESWKTRVLKDVCKL